LIMSPEAPRRSMPKWRPSPPVLIERFGQVVDGLHGTETRKMFGYPAAFINGHMFAGLFQDRVILRLSAADREEFDKKFRAAPVAPMGRPMREYMVAPADLVDSLGQLRTWVEQARNYAATLPPKSSAKKAQSKTKTSKRA